MKLNQLFPYCDEPFMIDLLNHEWWQFKTDEHGRTAILLKNSVFGSLKRETRKFLSVMVELGGNYFFGYFFSCFQVLKQGMKLVQLSPERCLTLENIEINVPYGEYAQPYESLCFEFPEEYRNYIQEKYKVSAPIGVVTYFRDHFYCMSVIFGKRSERNVTLYINTSHCNRNIEEIITTITNQKTDDIDFLIAKHFERVVLNANLLLVNYGIVKKEFINVKRHRALMRTGDIIAANCEPQVIDFKTQITYQRESLGGTHSSPTPHWRRGHYREQRYGVGNSLKKRILIAPTFIGQGTRDVIYHV